MKLSRADIERFWSKVDRSRGAHACWLWLAGCDKDNYGRFAVGPHGQQKHLRSARVVLFLKTRRWGPVAMHWKCDNPPCCNPRHLRWATQRENRADTVRKGREPRGERKPTSRLTERAVRHIRHVYGPLRRGHRRGRLVARLARRYGVKRITIYAVVHRHIWKWLR